MCGETEGFKDLPICVGPLLWTRADPSDVVANVALTEFAAGPGGGGWGGGSYSSDGIV